jgi:hypothetical protein
MAEILSSNSVHMPQKQVPQYGNDFISFSLNLFYKLHFQLFQSFLVKNLFPILYSIGMRICKLILHTVFAPLVLYLQFSRNFQTYLEQNVPISVCYCQISHVFTGVVDLEWFRVQLRF